MSTENSEYYGIFHTSIAESLLLQLDQIFKGKPIDDDLVESARLKGNTLEEML